MTYQTQLSSTGFGPARDTTDSKSFSISGVMKLRFRKLYLGFWQMTRKNGKEKIKEIRLITCGG